MTYEERIAIRVLIDRARRAQEIARGNYRLDMDDEQNEVYRGTPKYHRECSWCGESFLARRPHARFCRTAHQKSFHHANDPQANEKRQARKRRARRAADPR